MVSGVDDYTAHDAGLVRHRVTFEEPAKFHLVADLILWHDVRDVEVGIDAETIAGDPLEQWSVLIQYPRLSVKGPEANIRVFALAVARLAATNH